MSNIIDLTFLGDLLDISGNDITITPSGNFNVVAPLDVTGSVTADGLTVGTSSDAYSAVYIISSVTGESELRMGDTDTDAGSIAYTNSDDTMTFRAAAGARMALDSTGIDVTGDITLGDSNPTITMNDSSVTNLQHLITSSSDRLIIAADNNNVSAGTNIEFYVDGTERMRIDSSGNVNINGTDNRPLAITSFATASAGAGWDLDATSSNGVVTVSTGGTEAMRISSNGNVGIGTSSPDSYYSKELVVAHGTEGGITLVGAADTATGYLMFADGTTGNESYRGYIGYSHSTPDVMVFGTSASEAMRIDASGNLYLGATSGARGGISTRQLTKLGAGQAYLEIQSASTSSTEDGILFSDGSTGNFGLIGYNHNSDLLNFFTASAEAMRIDASGNLLVGITGVVAAGSDGVQIHGAAGYISSGRNTTSGASHHIFYNPNGIVGNIETSGSATTYNTSSDQRLKDNIVDAPSASDDIDAIQVRSFDWKADGSHQKYGMVAQELQAVAPEAVSAPEDPEEMMGVDYSKLVPMMLKEIQSLRARVSELES